MRNPEQRGWRNSPAGMLRLSVGLHPRLWFNSGFFGDGAEVAHSIVT